MFPYESVTMIRQVQPLILLLCFDGWFQSRPCSLRLLFLAANGVTNVYMNESWIIHPPMFPWSKCRGIAHSIICVWLHQVADGPCHRHQLRQQVSMSCVASQLTWLQWHCSCFCNTRLTGPTRPLMALHWSPQVSMSHTGILENVL